MSDWQRVAYQLECNDPKCGYSWDVLIEDGNGRDLNRIAQRHANETGHSVRTWRTDGRTVIPRGVKGGGK